MTATHLSTRSPGPSLFGFEAPAPASAARPRRTRRSILATIVALDDDPFTFCTCAPDQGHTC